jgi:hypothetical protein
MPQLEAERAFKITTGSYSITACLQILKVASASSAQDQYSVLLQVPSIHWHKVAAPCYSITAGVSITTYACQAATEQLADVGFVNKAAWTTKRITTAILGTTLGHVCSCAVAVITLYLICIYPELIADRTFHHTASSLWGGAPVEVVNISADRTGTRDLLGTV